MSHFCSFVFHFKKAHLESCLLYCINFSCWIYVGKFDFLVEFGKLILIHFERCSHFCRELLCSSLWCCYCCLCKKTYCYCYQSLIIFNIFFAYYFYRLSLYFLNGFCLNSIIYVVILITNQFSLDHYYLTI